jgi:hypothetical protein
MTESDLVIVGSFANRIEAEVAQGALHAAGIESVITADDAGGQYAALAFTGSGVRVSVCSGDREQAEEILRRASLPTDEPPAAADE